MKLSNEARRSIVERVMRDIPEIDYTVQMRARAVQIGVELMPPAIARLWKNPETQRYIKVASHYYCCMTLAVPGFDNYDDRMTEAVKTDVDLSALHAARDAQYKTRNALRESLRNSIIDCNTTAQFKERFPELASYAPDHQPVTANLPTTTAVIDALRDAGLPQLAIAA